MIYCYLENMGLQQYATTQLYSNLVNHVNSTTYLFLVLAVLCSLVVQGLGLPHCTFDNINGSTHVSYLICSLASDPFLY